MARPSTGDFAPYYQKYIDLAKGNSVEEIINNHNKEVADFYNNLPEEKSHYAYADDKWTVNDVIQHVIDAERVFSYRALRISRKDETPLPGFEENNYAKNAGAANRSMSSLKEEFAALRTATDLLLQSFTAEQLGQRGTASNNTVTVNAIAFIMFGHLLHHKNILQERYGV